jgi:hypothetical protein
VNKKYASIPGSSVMKGFMINEYNTSSLGVQRIGQVCYYLSLTRRLHNAQFAFREGNYLLGRGR